MREWTRESRGCLLPRGQTGGTVDEDLTHTLGFFDEANFRRAYRRRGSGTPAEVNRSSRERSRQAEKDTRWPERTLSRVVGRGLGFGIDVVDHISKE